MAKDRTTSVRMEAQINFCPKRAIRFVFRERVWAMARQNLFLRGFTLCQIARENRLSACRRISPGLETRGGL